MILFKCAISFIKPSFSALNFWSSISNSVASFDELFITTPFGLPLFKQKKPFSPKLIKSVTLDIFNRWDDEWSADKYIDETAGISYFEESSSNTIIAHGTFTVKRSAWFVTSKLNVKFTCKIRLNSSGSATIVNVCYQDSSVDMKDCCEPSKWGLDSL